jgi:hypothetical protein
VQVRILLGAPIVPGLRPHSPMAEALGLNPNQCGFESRCGYAPMAQLAEAADSNSAMCRFDSCSAHHVSANASLA